MSNTNQSSIKSSKPSWTVSSSLAWPNIFADLALRAAKEGVSHEAYLHELARLETKRTATTHRTACACIGLAPGENLSHLALSSGSPQRLQLQIERLKPEPSWSKRSMLSPIGKPGVGKSHVLAALGYELILSGIPSSGRQPARSCNGSSPPNGTCACPRSWPSWTNMPVSSSMILATFSTIATKWRCSLRSFLSAMNANRC